MSDPISREELRAIVETQSKATEQMVLVAKALTDILAEQKKIADKLSNGIMKDLDERCKQNSTTCSGNIVRCFEKLFDTQAKILGYVERVEPTIHNDLPEIKEAVIETRDDARFSKWFIGSVGLIIVVATVVLRGIDTRMMWTKTDKQATYDIKVIMDKLQELEDKK